MPLPTDAARFCPRLHARHVTIAPNAVPAIRLEPQLRSTLRNVERNEPAIKTATDAHILAELCCRLRGRLHVSGAVRLVRCAGYRQLRDRRYRARRARSGLSHQVAGHSIIRARRSHDHHPGVRDTEPEAIRVALGTRPRRCPANRISMDRAEE